MASRGGVEYAPERGDIVWIDFDPQVGHEQAGRRLALILSPLSYNGRIGLVLLCPITTRAKNYIFEVGLPEGLPVKGVVLSDQVKSMDWRGRDIEFRCKAPLLLLEEVLERALSLLSLD